MSIGYSLVPPSQQSFFYYLGSESVMRTANNTDECIRNTFYLTAFSFKLEFNVVFSSRMMSYKMLSYFKQIAYLTWVKYANLNI